MQVDPSVFKAYDIRGIVGKTIDEAVRRSSSAAPSAARRSPPANARSRSAATAASRARRWSAR